MWGHHVKIAFVAHWEWTLYNFRMPLAHALRERGYDVVCSCSFGEHVSFIQQAELPVRGLKSAAAVLQSSVRSYGDCAAVCDENRPNSPLHGVR